MYLEIGVNNQVLGYSNSSNGSNVFTDLPIPNFSDTQILKFINNAFVVEESPELLAEKQTRPLNIMRQQRDQLLSATDWWCVSDRTATPEQLAYRQALRDLPSTATPALDENGNLTGVEWPTKPE